MRRELQLDKCIQKFPSMSSLKGVNRHFSLVSLIGIPQKQMYVIFFNFLPELIMLLHVFAA